MSGLSGRVLCGLAAGAALVALANPADAVLIYYPTRVAFATANPGLPVEGFENVTPGTIDFTGPLDSTTSILGLVDPGDILAGIRLADVPGPDTTGLAFIGAGQSAQPTEALAQNTPQSDALDMTFGPSVHAVAFDIYQNAAGGAQTGVDQIFPVSIFGVGNLLLDTRNVTVASGGPGGFFGLFSSDPITRISVNNTDLYDVVDDVAFGDPVPEPGTLLLIGSGLTGLALRRRRRS